MVSVFELFVAGRGARALGGSGRGSGGGAAAMGTSCQQGGGSLVPQGCPEAVRFFLPGVLSPTMATFSPFRRRLALLIWVNFSCSHTSLCEVRRENPLFICLS